MIIEDSVLDKFLVIAVCTEFFMIVEFSHSDSKDPYVVGAVVIHSFLKGPMLELW